MSTSVFAVPAATPAAQPPDPSKHVNYTLGMVLGVDDFTQEFAYLDGRTEWLARDLLGYGTVCGLKVSVDTDATKGPRVSVAPGSALSVSGQLIYVTAAQCAYLNDWLTANQAALMDIASSPPGDVRLYLVLTYKECQTNQVPIPGEPCRTESESMAASRIADSFSLDLRLHWPQQAEEHAVRDFVDWLAAITVSDDPGAFTTLADFEDAVRAAFSLLASPPLHSPPAGIRIHSADVCEYLRAAFRIWITELRPQFHSSGPTPPANDEGLLLAELTVPVIVIGSNQWRVDDRFAVTIDETQRPVLVHLRMLQEYLVCGKCNCPESSGGGAAPGNGVTAANAFGIAAAAGSATTFSRSDHTHGTPPDPIPPHKADANAHTLNGDVTGPVGNAVVARLRAVPVDPTAPANGQVLGFSGGSWRPTAIPASPAASNTVTGQTAFGMATAPGNSNNYARADHSHGTPADPIPPHRADANAHQLLGDVTGSVGNSVVARIQGFAVPVPTAANNGQVLTFSNNAWTLQAAASAGGPVIVAAGRVRTNKTAIGKTFNNPVADVTGQPAGTVLITFPGYTNPDASPAARQYIIHAIPEAMIPSAATASPTNVAVSLAFSGFTANGFTLLATLNAIPLPAGDMAKLIIHLEIVQI